MKLFSFAIAFICTFNLFSQNVNIPDPNFKAYLVGNSSININSDSEIQVSEAAAFTGSIVCFSQSISSLIGIESFTNLTELNCTDNQLTSLDVSQNTMLTILSCGINQLTSLDVSQNMALSELYCQSNQLALLDVSQNTALTSLFFFVNQCTFIDVSQNTLLTEFNCSANLIMSLNLSQNTALTNIGCSENQLECLNIRNGNNTNISFFIASDNPNLTCIDVDDPTWASANLTNIDVQSSFDTNCGNSCSSIGIEELSNSSKQVAKIVDMMGKETELKFNTVLVFIYTDGSTEKKFITEH